MRATSTRSVGLLAGFAVIAIAALVWWFQSRSSTADEDVSTRAVAGPAISQERSDRVAPRSTPPSGVLDDVVGNETLTNLRRQQQRQEVGKVVESGRRKLVGAYESETIDRQWAGNKQRTLESLQSNAQIEELNARPSAFDVACRTSTCRIQADFPSRLAAEDWITLYLLNAGPEIMNSSVNRTILPDGTASIEIYSQAR